jgi:2-polyprenyl-3-methyl-5-hydroxy-6-metoxy-1,4-benzoquinol methylase
VVTRIEQLVRLGIIPSSSRGFKVLDYGCGSGFVASYLAFRFGWNSLCFDLYEAPFFSPSRRLKDTSLLLQNAPYHLVVASEVFEHFIDPRAEIVQIHDILDEDSGFVFVTTGLYLPGKRDQSWNYLAPQSGEHVCFYSQKTMLEIARLLRASRVCQVGAEYEWLFVRRSRKALLSNVRISVVSAFLRTGVKLRVLRRIE